MMKKWPVVPLLTALLVVFPNLVKADRFSVAVVGDTQYTTEEAPEVFLAQMEWIVANRNQPGNPIVYVATLGDMKDDGNCDVKNVVNPETGVTQTEWEILNFGYLKLDNAVPRIPYGVVPGNHDYFLGGGCFLGDPNSARTNLLSTGYNQFFGPGRFATGGVPEDWYGGPQVPGDNEDNFTLFSSHGIDFIAINLGLRQTAYLDDGNCGAPGNPKQLHDAASHVDSLCDLVDGGSVNLHDTELHWADALLDQYPNRLAIITSHYIMDGNWDRTSGNYRTSAFGPYGQQVYDYLQGQQNVFMMLGAHERGEAWIINNRSGTLQPVHGMLSNYQDLDFPDDTDDLTAADTYRSLPEHSDHTDCFDFPLPADCNDPEVRHGNSFSGFMRLMTFDTETGLVNIETFTPLIPSQSVASVTTTYSTRRDLPANAVPPNDRITSTRSTNALTNDNVVTTGETAPGLTLTDRSATNINNISFVGYVNLPPTASAVAITDNNAGTADVGDILTGGYSYNDLDGDTDSSSFRWLRNDLAIAGATAQNYTLAAADAGQAISFEVTPAANAGPSGVAVASNAIQVSAAGPANPTSVDQARWTGSVYQYGSAVTPNVPIFGAPADTDFSRWATLHDKGTAIGTSNIFRMYFMRQGINNQLYQFGFNAATGRYEYGFSSIPTIGITGTPADANPGSFAMLHTGTDFRLYMRSNSNPNLLYQFIFNGSTYAFVNSLGITGFPANADWNGWGMLHDGGSNFHLYAHNPTSADSMYQAILVGGTFVYGLAGGAIPVLSINGMPAGSIRPDFGMAHDGSNFRFNYLR